MSLFAHLSFIHLIPSTSRSNALYNSNPVLRFDFLTKLDASFSTFGIYTNRNELNLQAI